MCENENNVVEEHEGTSIFQLRSHLNKKKKNDKVNIRHTHSPVTILLAYILHISTCSIRI